MMRIWSLSELEAPLRAHLQGADCEISAVSTDSRKLQPGTLFVALNGDNFDGHAFLGEVREAGAAAAVVSSDVDSTLPLLRVADTQRALGMLGRSNREEFSAPLVAITGSSGKTTVKNMVQAVLSQRGETLATLGNLNNEIGVPQTLLRIDGTHEFAVVEMGAARAGDIAWLCEIGRPTISLLLNAMPAHLEGFGSVDDVAAAKGEIFDGLDVSGTAIINADQPWADQWRVRAAPAGVIDYALEAPAAVSARDIDSQGAEGVRFTVKTPEGEFPVNLQLPGIHNVSNALAAVAVGLACELSLDEIQRGLESVRPVAGRLSAKRVGSGAQIIDDCYNANPGSVRAAIEMLTACEGRRTLILGVMGELGPDSESLHREIGTIAKAAGLEQFIGVGEEVRVAVEAFGSEGRYFSTREEASLALGDVFDADDTVLIKGSRSAGMEFLLHALSDVIAGEGK